MKTKLFALCMVSVFALMSCSEKESDEFCDNPGAQCPDSSTIEASSCCTDQNCYWVYNGKTYNCDGDDCDDAIDAIVASACASASAKIDVSSRDYVLLKAQMQAVTQKLLVEARQASGCGE